jgi:hypothetical protein
MTNESPRRKARPSPIQVPLSPSRGSGFERPIATSTGIISARRQLSLDPVPLTAAPGIFGGEARRKRNSTGHLPPPKSAAANFAQQRGISTVTVRTTLPRSPHTGNDDASSSPRIGSSHAVSVKSAEERGLGSPFKTSGSKTSRTVEVDYLRNEMEKAMRLADAESTYAEADVRKDSEPHHSRHSPQDVISADTHPLRPFQSHPVQVLSHSRSHLHFSSLPFRPRVRLDLAHPDLANGLVRKDPQRFL